VFVARSDACWHKRDARATGEFRAMYTPTHAVLALPRLCSVRLVVSAENRTSDEDVYPHRTHTPAASVLVVRFQNITAPPLISAEQQ